MYTTKECISSLSDKQVPTYVQGGLNMTEVEELLWFFDSFSESAGFIYVLCGSHGVFSGGFHTETTLPGDTVQVYSSTV